ncbi:MAG TPA: ABC transporter ATP-binding protein, partial [Candidatus Limnocylindrales bacterium]|nr:ABC transporter ATP-binding protein [Candidatus Limnocylindrales bacterium]
MSIDPRDIAPSTEQGLLDARLRDDATPPPIADGGARERTRRASAIETALDIRRRRQWAPPKQAKPGAPLLDVRDLKTYFRLESGTVRAVDGVSFRLDYGEALGIVGESGCGKTTTALSLVQILPSNARIAGGEINLMGIDLVKKTENQLRRYRWREISIVFQGAMNALNPVQRVIDQIAEPIEQRLGEPRTRAVARARELLELVGIPKKRGAAYPHELSGGMRQRAMIAMALACDPGIVIGDEPTTALDVMVQAQILELLERLRVELGLSLILITHDLSVVAETCDRALVMYAGRVAEEG